ncbi:hypothetical protein HOLleu_03358 [Holothuria leucospilota]|uniref:Uncharacterized protein n=1 Tax=Holothuria leucospilota TaxID=206669 RepID=A0A9Q1HLB1_HOLLE|nr:hypothetical protein HOLleu_03358 [Holothuria leucospilota]
MEQGCRESPSKPMDHYQKNEGRGETNCVEIGLSRRRGDESPRRKRKWRRLERRIWRLKDNLRNGRLTTRQYWRTVSYATHAYMHMHITSTKFRYFSKDQNTKKKKKKNGQNFPKCFYG